MKNRFLLLCLLCLSGISALRAQSGGLIINGPTFLCETYCDTLVYTATLPNPQCSNPTYEYLWSNGMTSNVFYQCNGFPLQPGAYTLTVTATCANGVFASATQTVFIEPFTLLDIRSSNTAPCNDTIGQNICEKVCPNTTVTYSVNPNTPIGGTFGLYWEVQGAGSYTINNPPLNNSVTVVWGASGSGLVRLLVDGQSQCFSSNQLCVNIVPEPQAQFTTSPPLTASGLTVCEGQTLTFTNTSLAADYYEWFFSDDASITDLREKAVSLVGGGLPAWPALVAKLIQTAKERTPTENIEAYAGEDQGFADAVVRDIARLRQLGRGETLDQIEALEACREAVREPLIELDSLGVVQVVNAIDVTFTVS